MKVILQKSVADLGEVGDIKEVADGYARNFLLPRKLVIPARTGSTRAALHQKRLIEKKLAQRKIELEGLAEKLKGLPSLEILAKVGANNRLFGSVTAQQVAQALRNNGFEVDKRKIDIGDRIRVTGDYSIKLKLAENMVVSLKINVIADPESVAAAEEEAAEAQLVPAESTKPVAEADVAEASMTDNSAEKAVAESGEE